MKREYIKFSHINDKDKWWDYPDPIYLIYPGYINSPQTGRLVFISHQHLIHYYNVDPRKCEIVDDSNFVVPQIGYPPENEIDSIRRWSSTYPEHTGVNLYPQCSAEDYKQYAAALKMLRNNKNALLKLKIPDRRVPWSATIGIQLDINRCKKDEK